jgi:hypothetical protein
MNHALRISSIRDERLGHNQSAPSVMVSVLGDPLNAQNRHNSHNDGHSIILQRGEYVCLPDSASLIGRVGRRRNDDCLIDELAVGELLTEALNQLAEASEGELGAGGDVASQC